MNAEEQQVRRAAIHLAESLLDALEADYTYEEEGFKRWLTDGDPCELCQENEDAGWIPEDDAYPNADEPPQHPNCMCEEEYKERRVRVYD